MSKVSEIIATIWTPGLPSNGRLLGVVHDAVVEHASLSCTHLFVKDTPDDLVEFNSRCCPMALGALNRRCGHSSMVPPTQIPRNEVIV